MRREGHSVIQPEALPEYDANTHFSSDFLVDWIQGEDLISQKEVWLPASAGYLSFPTLYHWSSNGLASGNHIIEATLHGLYEVIERDAVSRLGRHGQVTFSAKRCRFIDLKTLDAGPVKQLSDRIAAAELKLVLVWVRSCIPVHTFMAVLLDLNPFSDSLIVNIGSGTHLSVAVAAIRAITEAAQSRATFIHGSREDLTPEAYEGNNRKLFKFFDRIEGTADWRRLDERAADDLFQDYRRIVGQLAEAGYRNVFRVDMSQPRFQIPVVKVWACGMKMDRNLF